MNKRNFGKTGLKVSEIGLGCRNLGGQCIINGLPTTYGDIDETTALTIIKKAIELGVNVFDTADIYSLGNCEKRLGRVIKEKRDEVLIFTKGGLIRSFDTKKRYEIDISFNHLIDALHRSLKRLETDFVDLFQVHSAPKSEDDFKNFEKTFKEMKNSNLTRFCGVSIGPNYKSGIELIKRGIVDTLQIYFSLLDYEPIDELLSLAKKEGVGIIIAKPLSQGFLAGKYQSNHIFPKNDLRSSLSRKEIDIKIDRTNLFKFLENDSRSLSQSALSYLLKREEVSTCIPTSNSIEQLKSNIEAADISITEDKLKQIIKIQESFKK